MHSLRILLWLTVAATQLSHVQPSILDEVAEKAVQSIKENVGESAEILRAIFKPNSRKGLAPKSRQKRIIQLPKGLVFQMKWWLDLPVDPMVRWKTSWEVEALIGAEYPSEFLQETEEPALSDIIPPHIAKIVKNKFTDGRDEEELEEGEGEELLERKKRSAGRKGREGKSLSRTKRAAQTERAMVYRVIERVLNKSGLPPRACLLRTICEVAEAPFEQELLGDLINTIFRPSKGTESSSGDDYDEFLLAEHHGLHNGSCHLQYGQCPETIFDKIPFFRHEMFF